MQLHHNNSNNQTISIGQAVSLLQAEYPELNASTLRFLESEGLVQPLRTPGGHRQYRSEDIDRIRFIRTMQRQRLPLEEIRERLTRLDEFGDPEQLADLYYDLITAGDLPGAAQVVRDADRMGLPLATIFVDVIGNAMQRVGVGWETGELLVGQEKEASELSRELVAELSARHATPATRDHIMLAAGAEGELHDLGLRMMAGLLREQGCYVHNLGANVAARFLIEAVQLRKPDVLLLAATMSERLPSLIATINALRREIPEDELPQIVVGGPIAETHFDEIQQLDVALVSRAGIDTALREILDTVSGLAATAAD